MNAPALLFDKPSHRYTVDGVAIPSVTEILAPLNSFRFVAPEVLQAAGAWDGRSPRVRAG